MRTHDPAHHEDHNRPRRESWAIRLLLLAATIALVAILLPLARWLDLVVAVVVLMVVMAAVVAMIPWGAFGQPDIDDDPEEYEDPESEVYPS